MGVSEIIHRVEGHHIQRAQLEVQISASVDCMKFLGDFLWKTVTNDMFESITVNIRDFDSENLYSSSED
jgi:hypothetical protein